jgi:hypothetical protein
MRGRNMRGRLRRSGDPSGKIADNLGKVRTRFGPVMPGPSKMREPSLAPFTGLPNRW